MSSSGRPKPLNLNVIDQKDASPETSNSPQMSIEFFRNLTAGDISFSAMDDNNDTEEQKKDEIYLQDFLTKTRSVFVSSASDGQSREVVIGHNNEMNTAVQKKEVELFEEYYRQGEIALKENNYSSAVDIFLEALKHWTAYVDNDSLCKVCTYLVEAAALFSYASKGDAEKIIECCYQAIHFINVLSQSPAREAEKDQAILDQAHFFRARAYASIVLNNPGRCPLKMRNQDFEWLCEHIYPAPEEIIAAKYAEILLKDSYDKMRNSILENNKDLSYKAYEYLCSQIEIIKGCARKNSKANPKYELSLKDSFGFLKGLVDQADQLEEISFSDYSLAESEFLEMIEKMARGYYIPQGDDYIINEVITALYVNQNIIWLFRNKCVLPKGSSAYFVEQSKIIENMLDNYKFLKRSFRAYDKFLSKKIISAEKESETYKTEKQEFYLLTLELNVHEMDRLIKNDKIEVSYLAYTNLSHILSFFEVEKSEKEISRKTLVNLFKKNEFDNIIPGFVNDKALERLNVSFKIIIRKIKEGFRFCGEDNLLYFKNIIKMMYVNQVHFRCVLMSKSNLSKEAISAYRMLLSKDEFNKSIKTSEINKMISQIEAKTEYKNKEVSAPLKDGVPKKKKNKKKKSVVEVKVENTNRLLEEQKMKEEAEAIIKKNLDEQLRLQGQAARRAEEKQKKKYAKEATRKARKLTNKPLSCYLKNAEGNIVKIVIPALVKKAIEDLQDPLKNGNDLGAMRTLFDGGYVRDRLRESVGIERKEKIIDYDLATGALEKTIYKVFAGNMIQKVHVSVNSSLALFDVIFENEEETTKITLFQRRALTKTNEYPDINDAVKADAMDRDFKINTYYANATGEVYDPLGYGLSILLKPPYLETIIEEEKSFTEDVIRILRLVYLTTSLEFEEVSPHVLDVFDKNKKCHDALREYINKPSSSGYDYRFRANSWIGKLLCSEYAEKNWLWLKKMELLETLFPALVTALGKNPNIEKFITDKLAAIRTYPKYYVSNSTDSNPIRKKDPHHTLNYIYALFIHSIYISMEIKTSTDDIIKEHPLWARNFLEWHPSRVLKLVNDEWESWGRRIAFKRNSIAAQSAPLPSPPPLEDRYTHSPIQYTEYKPVPHEYHHHYHVHTQDPQHVAHISINNYYTYHTPSMPAISMPPTHMAAQSSTAYMQSQSMHSSSQPVHRRGSSSFAGRVYRASGPTQSPEFGPRVLSAVTPSYTSSGHSFFTSNTPPHSRVVTVSPVFSSRSSAFTTVPARQSLSPPPLINPNDLNEGNSSHSTEDMYKVSKQ